MIYITQLIYLNPGAEDTFEAFEKIAIPIIDRYNGNLLLRLRPDKSSVIASTTEMPYEIHLIVFQMEADFENFMKDPERTKYLHLKEQSIRAAILIKGNKL